MAIIFTSLGFSDDARILTAEKIYDRAFGNDSPEDLAESYLLRIARTFAEEIQRDPDIELTRNARAPEPHLLLDLLRELPFVLGMEHVSIPWLENIWSQIADIFNAQLAAFDGSVSEYLKGKNTSLTVSGRVFFHLVETREEEYPFAFMATYSTKEKNAVHHLPLKKALEEYDGDSSSLLRLLATVSKAAQASDFISELMESGELFSPLKFEPSDSYTFLREVPLYEECGVICRIPDFWKRKTKSRLSLSLGSADPSMLGMQALLSFSPRIYFGDTEFSRGELESLLAEDDGLAFLKGKWVEVNKKRIEQILAALDQINNRDDFTFAEAMKIQAGITDIADISADTTLEISNGEWLSGIWEHLHNPQTIDEVYAGTDFTATLRQYQQVGLNWLDFMYKVGFGALLADDMGLGKTVQILALLNTLREQNAKTLLVVPASLLTNWQKESERFVPELRVCILHGAERQINLSDFDLFVTTYGMIPKLEKEMESITWDLLILDEAQAIKNPGIKQTKAVKSLRSNIRIAMTGTPIENRLSDLWSIFDFLNQGLLGTPKEFSSFTKRLKEQPEGYAKLRSVVSPFILRRLKTDKTVISDLPEKNERKQYTALSKKQIALYSALVTELNELFSSDSEESAIARKGKILAAILKFKQICNHPDQFNGQTIFDPKHSGKFEALSEICQTIRDKHESVLIFTQFREMCEPLSSYLETLFGQKGLVIHGGTTPKKRGEIVDTFNSEYIPFMVLSLKAGGVGLNLTAANHVVHFDRWWNPAIENQATDRAFRIGQTKDVMVHKFVTTGTIEEKIDLMIETKQKLAADIIGASTGENWVTEMSNDELMNLFRLEV